MANPLKVVIVGEGRHELGGRAGAPEYHKEEMGVVEALARRVPGTRPWIVVNGRSFHGVTKLRANVGHEGLAREARNVEALVFESTRKDGADAILLVRDRDGKQGREVSFREGVEKARVWNDRVAAGMAIETLDSWLEACSGKRDSERKGAKERLRSGDEGGLAAYLAIVESADLDQLPDDATSLRAWLSAVRASLS